MMAIAVTPASLTESVAMHLNLMPDLPLLDSTTRTLSPLNPVPTSFQPGNLPTTATSWLGLTSAPASQLSNGSDLYLGLHYLGLHNLQLDQTQLQQGEMLPVLRMAQSYANSHNSENAPDHN